MRDQSFRGRRAAAFITRLLGAGLLLCGADARALTTVEHSFDQLVALSEQILVGTVTRIDSTWGEGRAADTIFSTIRLRDIDTIKGAPPDGSYDLKVIGGVVGDQAQFYPGLPQFESGRRYLLFIRGNERAMFPITGVTQGFYRIQWDAMQEREIAIPATGDSAVPLSRSLGDHTEAGESRELRDLIGAIRASMAGNE